MKKQEIVAQLTDNHQRFIDEIVALSDEDFESSIDSKWTAGQQLVHIMLSIAPLAKALGYPKIMLQLLFGKSSQASANYDAVVKKYQEALKAGGKAPSDYVPRSVSMAQKAKMVSALQAKLTLLEVNLESYSDEALDRYRLPHPILGKVSVREMLYFTIYHVEHHRKQTFANLHGQAKQNG